MADATDAERAREWIVAAFGTYAPPDITGVLEDAFAEIREDEREKCAQLVEHLRRTEGIGLDARYFAQRIRERGGEGGGGCG